MGTFEDALLVLEEFRSGLVCGVNLRTADHDCVASKQSAFPFRRAPSLAVAAAICYRTVRDRWVKMHAVVSLRGERYPRRKVRGNFPNARPMTARFAFACLGEKEIPWMLYYNRNPPSPWPSSCTTREWWQGQTERRRRHDRPVASWQRSGGLGHGTDIENADDKSPAHTFSP